MTSPAAKPTVRIETITPAKAKDWLQGNVDNRRLREDRVLAHARTLQAGDWELTGDAIVFDDQGVLINGQHRLTGIVVADIPAQLVILRGLPSKAQEVMDTGLGRNLADQLHRRGLRTGESNILSGALYWLHQIAYNERTGNVHYATPAERPTLRQLLKLYDDIPDLVEHVKPVQRVRQATKVRPGPTVALRHRFSQIDAEEAVLFFDKLQTGTELARNDPIYRLREWAIEDTRMRTVKGRAPTYRYVAMTTKAWNFWRDGETTSRLSWVFTPTKREAWPIPH